MNDSPLIDKILPYMEESINYQDTVTGFTTTNKRWNYQPQESITIEYY